MKLNKIIFPVMACALAVGGCDDNKMEWGTPEGHGKVDASEIPLKLKEKLANYDFIKKYAQEYMPTATIGVGLGADAYVNDPVVQQIANDNYQMLTTGNAMKHQSVVQNDGTLKFTTIDNFLAAVPTDMKIYGHNFIWHTQQNHNYLKSLIAPTMKVQSDSNVANVLSGDASNFNGGTTGGWGAWGSNCESSVVTEGAGKDGSAALVLTNKDDGNAWTAQCAYTFDNPLQLEKTYIIKFKAKSTSGAGILQFQYQNSETYQSQGGYNEFSVGTDWIDCEYEFTPSYDDVNRILINFGKIGGSYTIDDIEFGLKIEDPMENIVTNSGFEDGDATGWQGFWCDYTYVIEGPGHTGDKAMHITTGSPTNMWDAQLFWGVDGLEVGATYAYAFWVKSDCDLELQVIGSQSESPYQGFYKDRFTAPGDWFKCEGEFTYTADDPQNIGRVGIQFGGVSGANLWVDDFKFGKKREQAATRRATTRGTTITYELKSAEEKRTALLGAMEAWIKGMARHEGMSRIMDWDVVNEPIGDNGKWRGFDNTFMDGDLEPVETTTEGLSLNWSNEAGNGHFYWGYYIGKDYACKAFEFARKYCAEGARLFVNDYNLETNPTKLAALVDFVKYIDENNATGKAIVDGIGTQMHVQSSITRAEVDAMFQTMAATGKLVRVTELDVAVGTSTPSADQLAKQAEVYQMIFDSYKANVPEAQQSGITIWSLSDNPAEHEYWLKDDAPNLFDANYQRKHAYKGVCDGIAGRDISEDFSGSDWDNAYKK